MMFVSVGLLCCLMIGYFLGRVVGSGRCDSCDCDYCKNYDYLDD